MINRERIYLTLSPETIRKLERVALENDTYISRVVDEAVKLLPDAKGGGMTTSKKTLRRRAKK